MAENHDELDAFRPRTRRPPRPARPTAADDVVDAEPEPDDGPAAELAALSAERDRYLDQMRRIAAEFDNYKKRVAREQESLTQRAGRAADPRPAAGARRPRAGRGRLRAARQGARRRGRLPRAPRAPRPAGAGGPRRRCAGRRAVRPARHEALLSQPSDRARGHRHPGRPEGLRARRSRAAAGPRRRRGAPRSDRPAAPHPSPSPRVRWTAPARFVTGFFWVLVAGVWVGTRLAVQRRRQTASACVMAAVAVALAVLALACRLPAADRPTPSSPTGYVVVRRRGALPLRRRAARRRAPRAFERRDLRAARLRRPVRLPRAASGSSRSGWARGTARRPAATACWSSVGERRVLVSPRRRGRVHRAAGGSDA